MKSSICMICKFNYHSVFSLWNICSITRFKCLFIHYLLSNFNFISFLVHDKQFSYLYLQNVFGLPMLFLFLNLRTTKVCTCVLFYSLFPYGLSSILYKKKGLWIESNGLSNKIEVTFQERT